MNLPMKILYASCGAICDTDVAYLGTLLLPDPSRGGPAATGAPHSRYLWAVQLSINACNPIQVTNCSIAARTSVHSSSPQLYVAVEAQAPPRL
jgi:hypothetical protein